MPRVEPNEEMDPTGEVKTGERRDREMGGGAGDREKSLYSQLFVFVHRVLYKGRTAKMKSWRRRTKKRTKVMRTSQSKKEMKTKTKARKTKLKRRKTKLKKRKLKETLTRRQQDSRLVISSRSA